MKITKEDWGKVRTAFGIICLAALIVSALVVGLPALVGSYGDTYLDNIKAYPPYHFSKADSLLQIMISRLEQRGLTKGEIDPYFHRFGNLEERYETLRGIQVEMHYRAQMYPKPEDTKGIPQKDKDFIERMLGESTRFSNVYLVEIYDMFHAKMWWTLIFFASVFGAAYGFLDLAKN